MASRRLTLLVLAMAAAVVGGCLPAASAGADPPYRQGLIDPEWDPLGGRHEAPQPQTDSSARDALLRCRRLEGKQLQNSSQAQRRLLLGCLGRQPPGLDRHVNRERTPHPLDLVLFDEARPSTEQSAGRLVGVVVAVAGDRVEFLYARGSRLHRGVLNLRRPDRRRAARGRVENTFLRIIRRDDAAGTRYLAGQLLAGFAAAP